MGKVIAFRSNRAPAALGPDDRATLDRLVVLLRPAGALRWEAEPGPRRVRAFILGAEDETVLIVSKGPDGVTVTSGYRHEPLWRGERLAAYAEGWSSDGLQAAAAGIVSASLCRSRRPWPQPT